MARQRFRLVQRNQRPINDKRAAEREAVRLLKGVGGSREWWTWNTEALVGHLRVPLTPDEVARIPPGMATIDAGHTGPERRRT